jgi:hypothetical protein
VAVVVDPAQRSRDIVAGGDIKRVDAPVSAAGGPLDLARTYAEAGLWYDLIDALSAGIAASPGDAGLREQRAALLEQVGLTEAAAHERAR